MSRAGGDQTDGAMEARCARRDDKHALHRRGPSAVFPLLAGSWFLDRSIDNGSSMTGTAMFAHCGNGQVEYHEKGRLRLGDGRILDAERLYLFEEDDCGFAVLFAEHPPRLFHRIVLCAIGPSLVGSAEHLCGEDRYDSRYEFRPDGSFVVQHAVRGPRKRYEITTCYWRDAWI